MSEGAERVRVDRMDFEAGERNITLYNPGEVQSSSALGDEWRFLSLYVDPMVLTEAFDLAPDTAFERPILVHDGVAFRMAGAIGFALTPDALPEEASGRLIQTLDELLTVANPKLPAIDRSIPKSLQRVAERLCEEVPLPSLQALSDEASLTRVQLVRAFTRSYGLPPFAWASNRRANEARRRLRKGEPLAEIAADLGFADQAHLTRRFRTTFGISPGR